MANPNAIERHGERFAIHPIDAQRNAEEVYIHGGDVNATQTNQSIVDAGNSSITPLIGGATFTGAWTETTNYTNISIAVAPNVASATNGLVLQWSMDGATVDDTDVFTIAANAKKQFTFGVTHKYFRVVYTNGATGQTTFRLQTMLHTGAPKPSSHRIQDTIVDDDDGELGISVLKLRTAQNNYVSGAATNSGNFKVSLEEVNGVVVPTTRTDDFYNDAFQRLRVSDTDQRFDAEFLYDKLPLLFDEIVGGAGTATHNANSRDVTLAIGGETLTDAAGLYQRWYNPYTPGNSQFIAVTGVLNGANIAGTASVFRRSYATGSVVEEVIEQGDWVGAASGVNWQYSQIFLIDFQSLKIGRIRFALDRGGLAVPVATMENDNERATGYWQMANAPIFWRVYNTATNTVVELGYGDTYNAVGFRFTSALDDTQTARAVCCTVKSEGGGDLLDLSGLPFAASNGATTKAVSTTLIPLLSIQLKTTFNSLPNRGLVIPTSYSFVNDYPIYYQLLLNATLTNASFASVDANSLCNFDVAATAVTGGRVLSSGYAGAGGQRASGTEKGLTSKIPLSVNYAGTTGDILTVCAVRVGAQNAATGAAIEWREVR